MFGRPMLCTWTNNKITTTKIVNSRRGAILSVSLPLVDLIDCRYNLESSNDNFGIAAEKLVVSEKPFISITLANGVFGVGVRRETLGDGEFLPPPRSKL